MKEIIDELEKLFNDILFSEEDVETTFNKVRPIIIDTLPSGDQRVKNYDTAGYLMEDQKLIDFKIKTEAGTLNTYQRDSDGDFILIEIRDANGELMFHV